MQLQAGYILEGVRDKLKFHIQEDKKNENILENKIDGLLNSLVTFDCFSKIDLTFKNGEVNGLLAVAHNIITRGKPTTTSPLVEHYYSDINPNYAQNFEKNYVVKYDLNDNVTLNNLFQALHPIDTRYSDRHKHLDLSQTDSSFENSFLQEYIPEEHKELAFIFQKQRARNTLGADDKNIGRVDFSFDIPYFNTAIQSNRFNQEVNVKNRKRYILEIDGKKYHRKVIDDQKDFTIADLKNNALHIREDELYNDIDTAINTISKEEYVKIIKTNFNSNIFNPFYDLVLSPIGIGRLQKVILLYLFSRDEVPSTVKIAVLERDLSFSKIAIDDLNELLTHLYELSGTSNLPPNFELTVYQHDCNDIKTKEFDLVIDISLLSRTSTINYNFKPEGDNLMTIRNCHFVETNTTNSLISAPSIIYKDLVIPTGNEQFEDITENKTTLEYFLKLIFRKKTFRPGQLPIIHRALKLKSVIGLLPTGGGKSITFQLAALLQPGITVVIDPIRSLMQDQYGTLVDQGIDRSAFINSSINAAEKRYYMDEFSKGNIQLLFVSPERFVIDNFRNTLIKTHKDNHNFSYGVIDEVHCVSEWGHDFRTAYLDIGKNLKEYTKTLTGKNLPILGLTATASYDVLADIERELEIDESDGDALVRYENTVRDEVNYRILETPIDDELLELNDEKSLLAHIGKEKQNVLTKLFENQITDLEIINTESFIKENLHQSYDNFLPDSVKNKLLSDRNDERRKQVYYQKQTKIVSLKKDDLYAENATSVIFCPHKKGELGVFNVRKSLNEKYYLEDIGYFVGGDNDKEDKESFGYLEKFKRNETRIMVATKAFGMGIDKENVRNTYHINFPQSIESFVQEAGRAGRDRKMSLSTILFNKDIYNVNSRTTGVETDIWIDKSVLEFFHKLSFKGKVKEMQTIYELRTKIAFPKIKHFELIQKSLNEQISDLTIKLAIGGINNRYLYVKNHDTGSEIGTIDLQNSRYYESNNFKPYDLQHKILKFVLEQVKGLNLTDLQNRVNALNKPIGTEGTVGIEHRLKKMKLNEEATIDVSFNNHLLSEKKDYDFLINQQHLYNFLGCEDIKSLKHSKIHHVENKFKQAIEHNLPFNDFIETLEFVDIKTQIDTHNVERKFYSPRNQADTSKAVYRLISLGIVETYTIDYANKLYRLKLRKREDGYFFDKLYHIFKKYSSKVAAKTQINKIKEDFYSSQKNETEISRSLNELIDFVYDKIAKKRKRAIDDMIHLCEYALQEESLIEQNKRVKEHIYYYFNAKYSRKDNKALINQNSSIIEIEASLINEKIDTTQQKIDTIKKYVNLLDEDTTASFKNNLKHLRGACMRVLRTYPDEATYKILKSSSLFILSEVSPYLVEEATREMISGFIHWKKDDITFDASLFMNWMKDYLLKKCNNEIINDAFDKIKEDFLMEYYTDWTANFSDKFLD